MFKNQIIKELFWWPWPGDVYRLWEMYLVRSRSNCRHSVNKYFTVRFQPHKINTPEVLPLSPGKPCDILVCLMQNKLNMISYLCDRFEFCRHFIFLLISPIFVFNAFQVHCKLQFIAPIYLHIKLIIIIV